MAKSTLTVSARLALAFGSLTLAFATCGGFALWQLARANARLEQVVDDGNVKLALATDLSRQVFIGTDAVKTMLLVADPATEAALAKRGYAAKQRFLEEREALRRANRDAAGAAALVDAIYEANDRRAAPDFDQFVTLTQQGRRAEAGTWLETRTGPSMQALQDSITRYADFETERNRALKERNLRDYRTARLVLGIALIGCTALVMAVGIGIARSLRRELGAEPAVARHFVHLVAQGDLSRAPPVAAARAGSLVVALDEMLHGLRTLVESVRRHADDVTLATREIADGTRELSTRTEQQAASLEHTVANMAQLTGSVKRNADDAREASALSHGATEVAGAGNAAVQDVMRTMAEIGGSSRKIADITGLIEGIAFQTNILALNAAVESARAGEHGRGFAVVAGEVRNLAQRSAAAAKEIGALVESSTAIVHRGETQIAALGKTIGSLQRAVDDVSRLLGDIAAASQVQSRGIEQVDHVLSQMDEVTQQNAALVEQAAAAAQSLDELAQGLKQAVSTFRLPSLA
ncbi:methyl-accepting chemotaxis protein [Burkholderia glumae]